uniref:MICAL like 1 n=1 Tax=Meleagris gallopavo TaxID=9103 RepID=A0A803Y5E2_MELGA
MPEEGFLSQESFCGGSGALFLCVSSHLFVLSHFRDFDSLSKDNVYENNRLAFELAERELGIPALLDPNDMVSMKVPDCLSIMTYVSQYYNHFNNPNQARVPPPMKRPAAAASPPLLAHKKPVAAVESSSEPQDDAPVEPAELSQSQRTMLSSTCTACQQHVHLVQRYLAEGKLYHRQCFRCKECSSTLLPGSYKPGSEAGTFVCTQHRGKLAMSGKMDRRPSLDQQSPELRTEAGASSVGEDIHPAGAEVGKDNDSVEETVAETQMPAEVPTNPEEKDSTPSRAETAIPCAGSGAPISQIPPRPPLPSKPLVPSQDKAGSLDGQHRQTRPTPAPRRSTDALSPPASHPVPRPRSTIQGEASDSGPGMVNAHHPISRLSHSEPSSSTPSPALSLESINSESSAKVLGDTDEASVPKSSSEPTVHTPTATKTSHTDTPLTSVSSSESPAAPASLSTNSSFSSSSELASFSAEVQNSTLHASRSVSTGSLKTSPSRLPPKPPAGASPTSMLLASEGGTGSPKPSSSPKPQLKSSCKENPFNRKPSPVASPSAKKPPKGSKPVRPPAPGHGFPLIKRKVQTDQYIPEEDIYGEMDAIEHQLDQLEHRGVILEEKLRSSENDSPEDSLLVDWFKLIHEKHMLVRHESELIYIFKQQNLEQRQADVEYELRCLLNKPEKDWTEEDRVREKVLMQELVTIIEQRNAIVNCLDEDRQREEEEDKMLEAMIKRKEFHKEAETETKKKGKFKPMKVLKLLGNKHDSKSKSPKEKS